MKIYLRTLIIIVITASFVGCGTSKFQSNYIKTELYFGLSKKNGIVTEKEWNAFKVDYISKRFSGYTEIQTKGFWTNPKGETVSENSRLIIYLNKGSKQDSLDIVYVINNYKQLFDQESVLKIDTPVRAFFK
ncbi:hypothetical protein KORDIASMS9_03549 [Kordia sp. SMS9]|uniref:DUF3574 domain-containing protein n=1 Tax=Kordia sp. SMS9 TaxID=2282170 RepID=UPI000E0DC378|nr:DUF3574 domain-containing protein [Kordia sp. SMS9]AXG71292.1 hypothetical protein KORDIASMS9_03549 [Kordia sp. SMS9]